MWGGRWEGDGRVGEVRSGNKLKVRARGQEGLGNCEAHSRSGGLASVC